MEKYNISSVFITAQRIDVLRKVSFLRQSLFALSDAIKKSNLPSYSPSVARYDPDRFEEHDEARKIISRNICQITYEDEQLPTESISVPGFTYATDEMFLLIKEINTQKQDLQATFKALSTIMVQEFGKDYITLDKYILADTSESRVNKKMMFRRIHYVEPEHKIASIGFTWTHVPVTRRLTAAQAMSYVMRTVNNDDQMNMDLLRLEVLERNEFLAHERRSPPKPRINISYVNTSSLKAGCPKMAPGVLPFFTHESNIHVMKVYPLKTIIPPEKHSVRKREKLENDPFCQYASIYRYQPKYRDYKVESEEEAIKVNIEKAIRFIL
jgi:hypothetical protein